ncbi:MAG: flagellar hook-basal body protein [Planctomycetes bacterium]|nr:flagellar hook-basal body protein [Planctomycetota bacterium]
MIYGLYLSAQGAQVQSTRQDVIANNLANASTTAFKRDLALFQAHRPWDAANGSAGGLPGNLGQATGGVSVAGVATSFRQGPLLPTGAPLDLALQGPGFFRVSDGSQELLTRNGKLTRDVSGRLVTQDTGYPVLSVTGAPILLPSDASQIEITPEGTVVTLGPGGVRSEVGQIDVVQPESVGQLEKVGNSFYRARGPTHSISGRASIRQGFLEESGVQPIREMMDLIESSRAFEANVNLIRTQDETLARLLQTVARR